VPFYGRYFHRQDDFRVNLQHVNSQSVDLRNESARIYPIDESGPDVFALGNVIVKSSYLHSPGSSRRTEIDYSYADANELQAISIAKNIPTGVRVPEIPFILYRQGICSLLLLHHVSYPLTLL
jgi:hypothetical protein